MRLFASRPMQKFLGVFVSAICSVLWISAMACAEGVNEFIQAQGRPSSEKVVLGDSFHYKIDVEYVGDFKGLYLEKFDQWKDHGLIFESIDDPVWVENEPSPSAQGGSSEERSKIQHWRQTLTLRPFQAGRLEIPPLTLRYSSGDPSFNGKTRKGSEGSLILKSTPIVVEDLEEGAARGKLESYTGTRTISFDWALRNFLIALISAIFLALSYLLWILRKKVLERARLNRPPPPPRPEHLVALEELGALLASTLLREGRLKAFYTQLSEILRRYLTARYQQPAMDWTTSEILEALEHVRDLDSAKRYALQEILENCDAVKFAKWVPPESLGIEIVKKAQEFVRQTKREEAPVPVLNPELAPVSDPTSVSPSEVREETKCVG